ncbi:MAG: PilZ domain-containing protein [Nitrospirae bacterium]|nr:PilZ domain-containing protein [Nitrospirota bacterium]
MNIEDRRRETRYTVPEIYSHYVVFKIKSGSGDYIPTVLLDFSRHGVRLKSPIYMDADFIMECLISIPASLSKNVAFKARVRYCIAGDTASDFIIGAEIIEIPDELWFNVFEKVHDFIRDRMGEVF